ncbi:hypothetical protein BDB00DRAFT_925041, partial [Zychaea mexicana]|uniref:uncharacterized protein n=1 Tax=Zychaea mexicana TaxID=64656 RepID=UPI0022FED2E9
TSFGTSYLSSFFIPSPCFKELCHARAWISGTSSSIQSPTTIVVVIVAVTATILTLDIHIAPTYHPVTGRQPYKKPVKKVFLPVFLENFLSPRFFCTLYGC